MAREVLKLTAVARHFQRGSEILHALEDVNLTIVQGDFVAITGPSGSGKSTLMSIMGCLDRVDQGSVSVLDRVVSDLREDEVAGIRCVSLGFVFQSYHLLADLSALENVALAGLYAGYSKTQAQTRAAELLTQVGLGDRVDHLPSQLSGGQQQRVAIARALFHEHAILLADEPTGALDSKSSADLMTLFHTLNEHGRSIVIVTHDPTVAAACRRNIHVHDGRIVADEQRSSNANSKAEVTVNPAQGARPNLMKDALFSSVALMQRRLTRTFLTLIGTIVGITAVIVIVALGDGAKQAVVATVGSLGSDLIVVMANNRAERALNAAPIKGFSEAEQELILTFPEVRTAVLEMPITRPIAFGGTSTETLVTGTNADFPMVHNWPLADGSFFTAQDERAMAPVIVMGSKVRDRLFIGGSGLGEWVAIGDSYFQVIGIMSDKGASPAGVDLDDIALIPFSSSVLRLGQEREAKFIMAKTEPGADLEHVATDLQEQLNSSRGTPEIVARTLAGIVALELQTRKTLTVLLSALSLISLLVGGVGITNITLISVVERTREIGLRKALGARRNDIAMQFLIETTVTSVVGGVIGVALGMLCVLAMQAVGFPAVFNIYALTAAVAMSAITGAMAGVLPARRAAALHPVEALLTP
jgi:macrolide transport system ATP-binding/permease protein